MEKWELLSLKTGCQHVNVHVAHGNDEKQTAAQTHCTKIAAVIHYLTTDCIDYLTKTVSVESNDCAGHRFPRAFAGRDFGCFKRKPSNIRFPQMFHPRRASEQSSVAHFVCFLNESGSVLTQSHMSAEMEKRGMSCAPRTVQTMVWGFKRTNFEGNDSSEHELKS